ncbi:O-antigen ligase family protein [Vibrio natriegens]|uniref:O-antigen ligase family protein n=1 Tax=Vibrio natriegens TaxID=691 RepID=UPI0021E7429E|nr:O-antigen ligase family protein [Vibrio natriegens]UYI46486.1 O-antigen ligase family protein [Vibrio natriegens]
MEAKVKEQSILSQIDNRLKLAVFLTPFMHFYLPFVGEFIVLCFQLSIIWLVNNLKNRDASLSFKPAHVLIFLYIASITISSLLMIHRIGWSAETVVSIFRYVVMVTHVIFIISLTKYFSLNDKLPFVYLPHAILAAVLLLFIDINFNLTSINYSEGLRIITSSNIRHLGHIVIVSTLYLSIKVLMGEKLNNILFSASTITSISLLIWLGGRGAILSYAIGVILTLAIIYKHNKIKIKNLVNLSLLTIVSVIISAPFNIYSWNGLNRLLDTKQYYGQDINTLSTNRIELWNISLDYIKENPFFGYGSESFILNTDTVYRHPHNFVVQWLFDYGVIGTALFLSILTSIITSGYIKSKNKLSFNNLISIAILLGIISNAMISGTMYYSPPLLIFCILASYSCSKFTFNKN